MSKGHIFLLPFGHAGAKVDPDPAARFLKEAVCHNFLMEGCDPLGLEGNPTKPGHEWGPF